MDTCTSDEESPWDEDESSSSDDEEIFNDLSLAVKEFNLKNIKEILKNPSKCKLIIRHDKKEYHTLLHVALLSIKSKSNLKKSIDVIKYLIEIGCPVETNLLDLLDEQSEKIKNFNWGDVKKVLEEAKQTTHESNYDILPEDVVEMQIDNESELSVAESSKSQKKFKLTSAETTENDNYISTRPAKRTLHGYTYQLKIIRLFLQQFLDKQEFFLATEMDEAELFDDVVLKFKKDEKWNYRFTQVKHKQKENCEISEKDLFKSGPYFLKSYYRSFCNIKVKDTFRDGDLEEFLICTNIDFSANAKLWMKQVDNDIYLNLGDTVKTYKLRKNKKIKLKEKFKGSKKNVTDFIKKFKFIVNLRDATLDHLLNEPLKSDLNLSNIDLATYYMNAKIYKWFESCRDKKCKFLQINDKKEYLQLVNNLINSLLLAGYSSFYIDDLRSHQIVFKNPLPDLRQILQNTKCLSVLVTSSPKVSTIKLCQIFQDLDLKQDEVIFVSSVRFKRHEKLINTYYSDPFYKWLVIECEKGGTINKFILDEIFKSTQDKGIIIIGQEGVVRTNKNVFRDSNSSFENLNEESQIQLLKRQVIFQGQEIYLNNLLNTSSAEKIIDDEILEKLIVDKIEIGDKIEFGDPDEIISNIDFKESYISRTLFPKSIDPHSIFQDKNVLQNSLFFISGADKDTMEEFSIEPNCILMWKEDIDFRKGIVIFPENMKDNKALFDKYQCKENVYWIEYEYVKKNFLIKNISEEVSKIPGICLQEDDLCKEEILNRKLVIIASDPGFGKSTYIGRVAHQLKQIPHIIWVLRINLSQYAYTDTEYSLQKLSEKTSSEKTNAKKTSAKKTSVKKTIAKKTNAKKTNAKKTYAKKTNAKKSNTANRATTFIANICSSSDDTQNKAISRELLLAALHKHENNYPKIILLFDGFDEISPTFKMTTLELLKALKESNVAQMWVTTRVNEEFSLEDALQSPVLHLNPLTAKEKNDFLNKCCENNSKILKQCGMTYDTLKLSANKLDNFTDNPLHLKMFIEVIFQAIITPKNSLIWENKSFLYEKFIDYKFDKIDCDNKGGGGTTVASRERFELDKKRSKKAYQELAFKILFTENNEQSSQTSNEDGLVLRPGILTLRNKRPEFVHRSFAEYFVCEYLAENFDLIANLIFHDILFSEYNYRLIKTFLNNNKQFLNKLANKQPAMISLIRQIDIGLQLYRLAEEQNYFLIINYLKDLPNDVKKQVLVTPNESKNTILHLFCIDVKDENIFRKLLVSLENCVLDNTLKTNSTGKTVFHLVLHPSGNKAITKKIKILLDFVKPRCKLADFHELLLQEDNLGNTVMHIACLKNLYQSVIYILESIKGTPQVSDLLTSSNGNKQNILHNIFLKKKNPVLRKNAIKTLKSISNHIKQQDTPVILYKMLEQPDNRGETALTLACRIGLTEVNCLLDLVKDVPELLKSLLKHTNEIKESVFHCIYSCGDVEDINKMTKLFLDCHSDPDILHNLLLQGNVNQNTALHLACELGSIQSATLLIDAVKGSPQIVKELILTKNYKGQTALHILFYNKNTVLRENIIKQLLDLIKNCSTEILHELLLETDNEGNTALHLTYMMLGFGEYAIFLIEAIRDNSKNLNQLILKTNCKGQTALHILFNKFNLCNHNNKDSIKTLIDLIKRHSSPLILQKLLLEADGEGNTALHSACLLEFGLCLNTIIEQIARPKFFTNAPLFTYNRLMIIENSSELLKLVKACCCPKFLNKRLLQINKDGSTALYLACTIFSSVSTLLEAVSDNEEILNKLLLKINYKGEMAFRIGPYV